jgi:hypothetical protein
MLGTRLTLKFPIQKSKANCNSRWAAYLNYADASSQAFQLHGDLYTLYFFSLFWGCVFFTFQHNLGTICRGELKFLINCYFHKKITHLGFQALIYMSFRSRIEHFEVQKTLQGSIAPKNLLFFLIWGNFLG